MKALILRTDNTVVVEQDNNEVVAYATLSSAVGGYIEAVALPSGMTLWVNEDGKNLGLPVNEYATRLFVSAYGATDIIVGNAIVTGGVDDEGNDLGLTDEEIDALTNEILFAGSPNA